MTGSSCISMHPNPFLDASLYTTKPLSDVFAEGPSYDSIQE